MSDISQLEQWRGAFGNAYIERNQPDAERLRSTTALWAQLLGRLAGDPPRSILEVGANVGANLHCLSRLTDAELWALEPNDRARKVLTDSGVMNADHILDGSAQKIPVKDACVDLAFTCGVLIHIPPEKLLEACHEIYRCARKYVVCIEYFAAEPEEKVYRGEVGLLFKRDFGSFWLDNFSDLVTIDCGFSWRRTTGLDNFTHWIFRKS